MIARPALYVAPLAPPRAPSVADLARALGLPADAPREPSPVPGNRDPRFDLVDALKAVA